MKKTFLLFALIAFCFPNLNAQFIEFRSSQKWTPPSNVVLPNQGLDDLNPVQPSVPSFETVRTTGYILTEEGTLKSKIQLKIKVFQNGNSVISGYYRIDPVFGGGNWVDMNSGLSVYKLSGAVPISKMEKVAYANFTCYAFWDASGKIWFNL